jgi:putrescine transport system permease protein
MSRRLPFALGMLGLGYVFLYGPIAVLIVYSFNASRLVTVWSGFSTQWYGALLHNEKFLSAAWLSLKIAAVNATAATVLATAAAFALVRMGRFPGRGLFALLLLAPLVLPEVMTALAMLLTFVALEDLIGWPSGRGATTITIAHITFSLAYVTVVVRARLLDLDPRLEEAAADLGAPPHRVFLSITLPLLGPAVAAGWLLAFTLSLDDLVIASFVSGPGSSTLPLVVFSSVRLGLSPEVNALATILIGVVAAAVGAGAWLMRQRN